MILSTFLIVIIIISLAQAIPINNINKDVKKNLTGVIPLTRAYAHNDQDSAANPLTDALENTFCNIETDTYLINNTLYVGHDLNDLKGLLEELYLTPLAELVWTNDNGGGSSVGGGVYGSSAAKLGMCEVFTFFDRCQIHSPSNIRQVARSPKQISDQLS